MEIKEVEIREKIGACGKEIEEILKKYNCYLACVIDADPKKGQSINIQLRTAS